MHGRFPLALLSLLCVSVVTTACSVRNRPKRQFAGELTSNSQSCPKTHGTLIIQRDEAVFAPDDGTWTLEGKVTGATVEASRSRPSFDHKTYATELKATLTANDVVGTYVTPTCSYAVRLTAF